MVSGSRFRVHSPFIATSLAPGRRVYVTLTVGTTGEVLEVHDEAGRASVALIQIDGKSLLSFLHDLKDCSDRIFTEPAASLPG